MDSTTPYAHPARWYDTIYAAQGKDYVAEAGIVDALVRARTPDARSLLDVGCGTGRHLAAFSFLFDEVVGMDATPAFVDETRALGLEAFVGDMRELVPAQPVDVVTSLFSAVGHMATEHDLDRAIASMAGCLLPGGVLVVEPWFTPEQWREGEHGVEVADGDGEILVRANRSGVDGHQAVLEFAWTHVDATGITRLDEELRLSLFPRERYREAFEHAGLEDVAFDPAGCNGDGRGLWIGSRPAG